MIFNSRNFRMRVEFTKILEIRAGVGKQPTALTTPIWVLKLLTGRYKVSVTKYSEWRRRRWKGGREEKTLDRTNYSAAFDDVIPRQGCWEFFPLLNSIRSVYSLSVSRKIWSEWPRVVFSFSEYDFIKSRRNNWVKRGGGGGGRSAYKVSSERGINPRAALRNAL